MAIDWHDDPEGGAQFSLRIIAILGTESPFLRSVLDLADARAIVEAWRVNYNGRRPHSALGYRTPEQVRTGFRATTTTTTTATTTESGRPADSHNRWTIEWGQVRPMNNESLVPDDLREAIEPLLPIRNAQTKNRLGPCSARRWIKSGERLGSHRWVVERIVAWLLGFRRLAIRYERRAELIQGLLHMESHSVSSSKRLRTIHSSPMC
jgi:Integrase core domain